MEKENKIIQSLKEIDTLLKDENINFEYLTLNTLPCLVKIADYLNVNYTDAIFFSVIFTQGLNSSPCNLNEISKKLRMDIYELMDYLPIIKKLSDQKLVKYKKNIRNENIVYSTSYSIPPRIFNAIVKNINCPMDNLEELKSNIDVIHYFAKQVNAIDNEELELSELESEYRTMLLEYEKFGIIKFINDQGLKFTETFLLLYTISKCLEGSDSVDFNSFENAMFHCKQSRVKFTQSIALSENILTKNHIVEFRPGMFMNDFEVGLTSKTISWLKSINIILGTKTTNFWEVIEPQKSIKKELYHNNNETEQLRILCNLLEKSNFENLVNRMSKKGLQPGVNILFYGKPGTGKTESVVQLGKLTDRKILTIDISNLKSKWFGQSEKIIKNVFREYSTFCESEELTPILLFNEADAIFSKRKSHNESAVSQTENAIQNILLNELERFKGILVATTNLDENFDTAFERRFLYKIHFNHPEIEQRINIWKSRFITLELYEANQLANEFDFTGAIIENIYRKIEIEQLLFNTPIDFNTIYKNCLQEYNANKNNNRSIGFNIA
jgi:hypothetical protein